MPKAEKKTASGKITGVKKQKQGNTKTQKPSISNHYDVLQTRSSPKALCNAMLKLKLNQKACLEEVRFGGMVELKVDGIPSKLGLYVVNNLDEKKMEDVELNCGGFGNRELEEDFVDEEGTNATMLDTQEKEKDVQGEAGCPNMNRVEALNEEVEVHNGNIGVNEQTPCSDKDLMGLTKKCVGQDACSLFEFDRQENMCGLLTQKAFESIADEVELSIEKSKSMEIDDRPSFSFGVTQDFDVIPVTKNENKVLTPMPISV
nr:hypothetical protein [Tanacetum cinerariifolium]